ncbi:hypothetical protein [Herbaspirillum sp. RV1423]|uniref:hypothetical protein n=1 Tax=Herbaspirillum sp. RV1423 TaxID=1443993 RepID=UPI0004BCAF7C|nr:hypothetical protein [Herbaspirillum sp. RV1423]
MYSDKEKSIHFLIMPDSQTSKAIDNPDISFSLGAGNNWNILTEMLENTQDEAFVKSILVHFKDSDFEDEAFIEAFGSDYVNAIKKGRRMLLKKTYAYNESIVGRRLDETTMQAHLDRYHDDLIQRLNQVMDEMTTSQSELMLNTWLHAVKFVGGVIAIGLSLFAAGAGVAGRFAVAGRFGLAGLTTAIATETGVWLTKKYTADHPAEAEAAFRAWLATVVTETVIFLVGVVPAAKWVYKGSIGAIVTDKIWSKVVVKVIERTWGPSIGLLGLKVGPDFSSYLENAIARELIKQGMPDPREILDFCESRPGNGGSKT